MTIASPDIKGLHDPSQLPVEQMAELWLQSLAKKIAQIEQLAAGNPHIDAARAIRGVIVHDIGQDALGTMAFVISAASLDPDLMPDDYPAAAVRGVKEGWLKVSWALTQFEHRLPNKFITAFQEQVYAPYATSITDLTEHTNPDQTQALAQQVHQQLTQLCTLPPGMSPDDIPYAEQILSSINVHHYPAPLSNSSPHPET